MRPLRKRLDAVCAMREDPGSVSGDGTLHRGALMVAVNDAIADAAAALDGGGDSWSFYCECDAVGCTETRTLQLSEFRRLRDGGAPLLADGHRRN